MRNPAPLPPAAGTETGAMRLSFVLPAKNEERTIGRVLDSIRRFAPDAKRVEVVVVDHGSTDRTVEIARARGAHVLLHPAGTVGALRNVGVAHTTGTVIVFLDADVLLLPAWRGRIDVVLRRFQLSPDLVTGSRCGVSQNPNWMEVVWFQPLLTERAHYINSGHMITSRALFDRVGGFDSGLETGEDCDFSTRARAVGAEVINDPALEVTHEGYPKTLLEFWRRERWHGRGNFQSWRSVCCSSVELLTMAFVVSHLALLVALAARSTGGAVASAAMIAAMCLVSAVVKHRGTVVRMAVAAFLQYVYFAARSVALADVLGDRLMAVRAALGGRRQ
jgi:glycosyltransferase involved in cell wall biosynthesis